MQTGIEVDVLFGGDGGIRTHVGNADQLRGGVTYLELMRGNLETVKEALG